MCCRLSIGGAPAGPAAGGGLEAAPFPSFRSDLLAGIHPQGSGARMVPYWSVQTASGVMGDATKATKEKGERFLEAAICGLVELVRELKGQEILPRRDQH